MPRKNNQSAARTAHPAPFDEFGANLELIDSSLLDVLDNLLNNGVVLQGELVMGLANIDLIYARLSLLLCAVDRLDEFRSKVKPLPGRSKRSGRPPQLARPTSGRSRDR